MDTYTLATCRSFVTSTSTTLAIADRESSMPRPRSGHTACCTTLSETNNDPISRSICLDTRAMRREFAMQVTERAAFFDPVFVRNTACWPHGTRGDGTSEREPRLVLWIVLCMRTRGDRVLGPTTPVRYARPDSIGLRARTGRAGKTGRTGRTR